MTSEQYDSVGKKLEDAGLWAATRVARARLPRVERECSDASAPEQPAEDRDDEQDDQQPPQQVNREADAEHDERQDQEHNEQSHHFLLVVVRTVDRPAKHAYEAGRSRRPARRRRAASAP